MGKKFTKIYSRFRFLATGMSFRSIAFSFRLGETTINRIVKETCFAIKDIVMLLYIPNTTSEKWTNVQMDFYEKWNFPNCVGAVDGKRASISPQKIRINIF